MMVVVVVMMVWRHHHHDMMVMVVRGRSLVGPAVVLRQLQPRSNLRIVDGPKTLRGVGDGL